MTILYYSRAFSGQMGWEVGMGWLAQWMADEEVRNQNFHEHIRTLAKNH
jgi:hypothetical protein